MSGVRTTNFDAVAASAPLNRQASTVRDGSGDMWEAGVPNGMPRWIGPPPLKSGASQTAPAQVVMARLVGKRFGRLTVLGIWAGGNAKKKAVWVCRCDCGYYEGRKARFLEQGHPDGEEQRCSACDALAKLQRSAAKPSTKKARVRAAAMLDRLAEGSR